MEIPHGFSWPPCPELRYPKCHVALASLEKTENGGPASTGVDVGRVDSKGATERNEELSLPAGYSREIPWQSPCTRKGVSNEIDSNDSEEGPNRYGKEFVHPGCSGSVLSLKMIIRDNPFCGT